MKILKAARQVGVIVIAAAAFCLILAYMSGGFHEKVTPEKLEPPRRTVGDQPTDIVHKIIQTERIEVTGSLRAERRTEVSARIMASIVEINARAGAHVAEGAVLVRLDDRDLRAQFEQAKQAEIAAEAGLQEAQSQFERLKSLLEQKVASRKEFEQAEANWKIAQANVRQAHEAKSGAETLLSYAVIKAPAGGIVVDKLADVGDTAAPGRPLLTIYDPAGLRLEAAVPEALASGLATGDVLEILLDSADANEPLEGAVEEIVPQADAASRSVLVKVKVPSGVPGLVEGGFGRILIPSRERVRLCLAQSAVREVGQLRFVDVVGENGIVERRLVTLGERSRLGRVEALSGVEADERVILYGPAPQPLPPGVRLFGEGDE